MALSGRLIQVQVYKHEEYSTLAREQYQRWVELKASRGRVLDRRGHDLAVDIQATSFYAYPDQVADLERVAAQGDQRPMAGRSDPLAELRTLLLEREPLYAEADVTVDTSALSPEDAVKKVIEKLERSTIGA